MRIISGQFKGRRLNSPKGSVTRPTPDRVREALFSILGARVEDACVLDLFAGTGCLGLECLSRGAKYATFVEKDRRVYEILSQNVQIADSTRYSLINAPAQRALRSLSRNFELPDLIFLDPPYDRGLLEPALHQILRNNLIQKTGTIICEHHAKSPPPELLAPWTLVQTRLFGDVGISFIEYGAIE